MLIKLLFLAIILYFVVKTARSLIHAVRGDGRSQELEDDVRRPDKSAVKHRDNVEDARYVDL